MLTIGQRRSLTEEEKRQNHIKSEKHRRDLIKNQYECLDDLVLGIKTDKSERLAKLRQEHVVASRGIPMTRPCGRSQRSSAKSTKQ